jgi:hypothetical protein
MKHTTALDGIEIEFEPCDHCARIPMNGELEAAVAAAKKDLVSACALCGEKFRIWRIEIYHYKVHGTDKWGSHGTTTEPALEVSVAGHGGVVTTKVHDRCLRNCLDGKMLPEVRREEIRK